MKDSPAPSSAATPAASWKQRYEALRQLVVAGNPLAGTEPLGLVLLVRQGMARWMHRWPGALPTLAQAAGPPAPPPVLPTAQWQQQLTTLLAQMSLAHFSAPATL